MPLNTKTVRNYLKDFDFKSLFIEELGWNKCNEPPFSVSVDDQYYQLTPMSEMGGMLVLRCSPNTDGKIPEYSIRRKIDREVSKLHYEHIIIYCDSEETEQIWQWVKREKGEPAVSREHHFRKDQSGEPLIQRLNGLVFTLGDLDDEGNVPIISVLYSVKQSLDVDRVTKRFYDRFKKELGVFQGFISGIDDTANKEWYASLMLNRLMFVYFIQKKGFLDGDIDYLRKHLKLVQNENGKDKFHSFYRYFLLRLFHEGLGSKERSPELDKLIGKVPYLNGGLFEIHDIEKENQNIQIPDQAFENIFNFFDQYQWHLDERPTRNDREINPDVLGYIFEKYINQKQMGAYYTKEDITEYISKNTIIPYIFDAARKKCPVAFEGDASVWKLLQSNPDRYIYDAVKKGANLPLPQEIAAGINDVSMRTEWNKLAPSEYALPTEIWREVVARRRRYEEVKAKMQNGEVQSIDDLITYNLDIRQFAQDVIENWDGSDLIRAFYQVIKGITVLDPTCGSGAFLFAALNILEPLYEACLGRMREFLSEIDNSADKHHPNLLSDFRDALAEVEKHPNSQYFIYKSIILNNLFGVDIMEEAVEICRLRLFLKLASQVDFERDKPNYGLEPLPDIDFNIKAGNTLVGFATYDEVKKAITSSFDFDDTMSAIEEKAQDVDRLWARFREQQTTYGGEITKEDKQELKIRQENLEHELDQALAGLYGDAATKDFDNWLKAHQPFHWFVNFYGIISRGGFDVIIGNPPYVEYSKVKKDYTIIDYETKSCGNLYAFVIERLCNLIQISMGRSGMIIPHSSICTDRMSSLQSIFKKAGGIFYISSYDTSPARLFVGVDQRLAIYLLKHSKSSETAIKSSSYHRWHEEFRSYLFSTIHYVDGSERQFPNSIPKLSSTIEVSLWHILENYNPLSAQMVKFDTNNTLYYHNAPRYWIRAMDFIPYFWNERDGAQVSSHMKTLKFSTNIDAHVAATILNSSLFYWWFISLSNCRDLNMREIENFPAGLDIMSDDTKNILIDLEARLMEDLKRHSQRKECFYKSTGKVIYDEFYPKYSKPIIDEIDRVLAKHYGFTDEELDYIINYDIKYRMGLGGGDAEEDE